MHEYAVTQNILNIIIEEAKKSNFSKITKITLVIGELSSVIDESIQMYFDFMSKGTIAEDAILSFNRVPAEFICKSCKNKFKKQNSKLTCPSCGSLGLITDKGKEFYIDSIETL